MSMGIDRNEVLGEPQMKSTAVNFHPVFTHATTQPLTPGPVRFGKSLLDSAADDSFENANHPQALNSV
jgi:hypothetical protein